jgi:hypothetical protein
MSLTSGKKECRVPRTVKAGSRRMTEAVMIFEN